MRLVRFDSEVSRKITEFGSVGLTLAPLARFDGSGHIICMRLEPDGFIGYHEAAGPQLFIVVEGEGWAQGGPTSDAESSEGRDDARQMIGAGMAALWEAGEWHAAGTATGMTAIVIDGPAIEPAIHPTDTNSLQ